MMTMGKLISLEGIEGAGKSTALQFIKEFLKSANINVVWTREPGGTAFAEEIRKLILHSAYPETIEPETELLMMFAGRAQHLKHVILPALQAGKWVVCDRYIDASYAYQAGGRGIDTKLIQMLDQWIVGKFYPDLTLLLDISPELGFKRTEKRDMDKDRIEQEKMDFFERVRETYLQRAKLDPARIKIIDASLITPKVEWEIRDALRRFFKEI